MNLIGKIFIVLIFIMSLMFATFSIMVYTTHVNWRQEILRTPAEVRGAQQPGYKFQLEQARTENARLNDELASLTNQLNAEKAAKIQALAKSEATIQALTRRKENHRRSAEGQGNRIGHQHRHAARHANQSLEPDRRS